MPSLAASRRSSVTVIAPAPLPVPFEAPRLRAAALAPSRPSAVRVFFGRLVMVRFLDAPACAFLTFLRAACRCFCVAIGVSLSRHVVVLDRRLALDQEALVLRVVDGGLDVVTGEGADRVQRVPQREGEELGALAFVAAEHPCAAVTRGLAVGREAGVADVLGVFVAVLAANDASPNARDHQSSILSRRLISASVGSSSAN